MHPGTGHEAGSRSLGLPYELPTDLREGCCLLGCPENLPWRQGQRVPACSLCSLLTCISTRRAGPSPRRPLRNRQHGGVLLHVCRG